MSSLLNDHQLPDRAALEARDPIYPAVASRDLVPFPSVMTALYLDRMSALRALDRSLAGDKLIFVVAQRNYDIDEPAARDLYRVGVVAKILKRLNRPDGGSKVIIHGVARGRIRKIKKGDFLETTIELLEDEPAELASEDDLLIAKRIRENIQVLVEREHLPEEMLLIADEEAPVGVLADSVLAHYRIEIASAQKALEELNPHKRLILADNIIADDINRFFISENIRDRAREQLNVGQREHYLREQIRQIQEELGDATGATDEIRDLRLQLDKAKLPKSAKQEALSQLSRLERISPESSEYALLRTYLEWLADLPWSKRTKERLDLATAKKVLNRDHFGLDKVKDRIIEFLSIRKLNRSLKGPILCLVGPPGVGKTSLGRSIAEALNRKFFRMSLGGVRDEAEIRGHRRTYVGALPGRIIQGLKQAGSKNCLIVLDELDKVGNDFRGDPASALLEVLDPQQNKEFRDHYLNVTFDLSEIMFVATANTVDTIPEALIDRLEVIYLPGYTTQEKEQISKRFIIPLQLEDNGLKDKPVKFNDAAITFLIERYTAEAGVRSLEREIASLCRKIARRYCERDRLIKRVTPALVERLLGPTKVDPEQRDDRDLIGMARGLAWTVNGGEIMPIEASIAKGSGTLTLTGQLGSVMQESAQAAVFYARANAEALGLDQGFHQKFDIHVHVPSGATPKDGPSAGITIACCLVSALSGRKVSSKVAMTGEITLRGNVLAVGGLKEKALAALRYGMETVIIPHDNLKDLREIPKEQRDKIKFIPVRYVSEVFDAALLPKERKRSTTPRIRTKKE